MNNTDNPQNNNAAETPDVEFLRATAWDIAEQKPAERFSPTENHVALAMVTPCRGFSHWRIALEWIEDTRRSRADAWRDCRMILRLYDVSYITFNGLNASHIQDVPLPSICGQMFFNLPHAGTWQLGEIGFLLRDGEFIPAARSNTISFPRASTSSYGAQDAMLVDEKMKAEAIGNIWDQANILKDRNTPKLREHLRIALLCLSLDRSGPPEFVVKLATGLCEKGHEVHIFTPPCDDLHENESPRGLFYHAVDISIDGTPQDVARAFHHSAEQKLKKLPPFDIVHVHDWMAGLGFQGGEGVKVCSLTSLESTRRNGEKPTPLSAAIEDAEREVAGAADVVLTPNWLHDRAVRELRLDAAHVLDFAMEGRLPNEWDSPLDFGEVKREINFGPLDRMVVFIGPLEYAAGPDLLVDALPTLLQRIPNLRVAFAGAGEMLGSLPDRVRRLGVSHAVRFLGHVDRTRVSRLLRASESLVLPSRYRVPFDDAVVTLARLAGRPVITTHSGPAHLVRHEETGVITYDNPGSMVWALDRILGDPANSRRMGENGRREDSHMPAWNEVAHRYLELCAASCPQLLEMRV